MIYDMAVRGYTPSDAFLSDLVSFGIGGFAGYGLNGAMRNFSARVGQSRVATGPNEAVFWPGRTNGVAARPVVERIARTRGGKTLGKVLEERGIVMPEYNANIISTVEAWRRLSREFAENASGEVRSVIGQDLQPINFWQNVELRALIENLNVSRIIRIDPATFIETILFSR